MTAAAAVVVAVGEVEIHPQSISSSSVGKLVIPARSLPIFVEFRHQW